MPLQSDNWLAEREVPTTTIVDPLLRINTVLRLTGLSKSALYREVRAGKFPRPVKVSDATVGWRQSDIVEWINSRPEVA